MFWSHPWLPPSDPLPPPPPRLGRWLWLVALTLGLAALGGAGWAAQRGAAAVAATATDPVVWARASRALMGTVVDLWAPSQRPAVVYAAFERALGRMRQLEVQLTHLRREQWPPSDPLRLAAAAGQPAIAIGAATAEVLALAKQVAIASDGAFDPTCAPLGQLWPTDNLAAASIVMPSAAARGAAAGRVDHRALEVDLQRRRARLALAGSALDLGGIAKGYILAAGGRALRAAGVAHFVLSAGGDAVFAGHPPAADAWPVALRGAGGQQVAQLALRDRALAVSGPDARWVWANDQPWHHLVDCRLAAPAQGAQLSAVVAADGCLADALASALFVADTAQGAQILACYPQVEALRLQADGQLYATGQLPLNYPLWPSRVWR